MHPRYGRRGQSCPCSSLGHGHSEARLACPTGLWWGALRNLGQWAAQIPHPRRCHGKSNGLRRVRNDNASQMQAALVAGEQGRQVRQGAGEVRAGPGECGTIREDYTALGHRRNLGKVVEGV